jgi:hypothetical protein
MDIRSVTLRDLLEMRSELIQNPRLRMPVTVAEINSECDRRARKNVPLEVLMDPEIYTP